MRTSRTPPCARITSRCSAQAPRSRDRLPRPCGPVPCRSSLIDWLKANFFRTELELGHCLRLPQEGPCECDLYLTCAKFVTTQAYAPRLRGRRSKELAMVEDARQRGFEREAERHARVVARIEALLAELGERVNDDLPPAHDTGT